MSKGKKCTSKECKRFELSQAAHRRLAAFHSKSYRKNGRDVHWIRNGYHIDVFRKQKKTGRVLTGSEKEKVYKNNEYYFYN